MELTISPKEAKYSCLPQSILFSATVYVYCETLNVCVPFISQARQNREIKGREFQLQAKNRTKLLQYFELYGFNFANIKGAKIILDANSPTFRAAKLKGFTVCTAGEEGNN